MKDTSTESSFMYITTTDDISLETQWHPVESGAPARAVAVATHPHPLHGGDMHNVAPEAFARSLPAMGISVLRFNFRGVGASTGDHDNGGAEHLDVHAAITAAAASEPGVPVILAGYSFGADMALDFATDAPPEVLAAVAGVLAVAPPLRMFDTFSASKRDLPKHLLVPAHDQFRPPESAEAFVGEWTATTQISLPGTDHFLLGSTEVIVEAAEKFISALL